MNRLLIALFIATVGILPGRDGRLYAQTKEPLLGTWVLDRAQSTFSGAVPDRRTMIFDQTPQGLRHITEGSTPAQPQFGVLSDERYRFQYTFKVDGKDYPADPQMPINTVSFSRVDGNTIKRSGKYQGQVVETVTYAVSPDRKTLTVTQDGNSGSSVQVFTRQ